MKEKKLVIGNKIFTDNCKVKLNNENFKLKFIEVGYNTFNIEIESADTSNKCIYLGEWRNGEINTKSQIFELELID